MLYIYLPFILIFFITVSHLAAADIDVEDIRFETIPIASGTHLGEPYKIESFIQGLGIPWGLTFIPNNILLIAEKSGVLLAYYQDQRRIESIKHPLDVFVKGQGGLLDVALSPNQQWIYVTYAQRQNNTGITVLSRAKVQFQNSILQLTDWTTLLASQSASDNERHYGSRITFDDQGHVYISIGDRGNRPNGQDLTTHAGSLLRLKLDGSVPKDNPFVKHHHALPEIWSYGHRNPQGIYWDATTRLLWAIEHGPRGGDEVNIIEPGANYGWAKVSHGKEYWNNRDVGEAKQLPGMLDPVKIYTPSIAPSSLLVYRGNRFRAWQGHLFAGALKLRHLNHLVVNYSKQASHIKAQIMTEHRLLEDQSLRIRDVVASPSGEIVFSTDDGNLYRIFN